MIFHSYLSHFVWKFPNFARLGQGVLTLYSPIFEIKLIKLKKIKDFNGVVNKLNVSFWPEYFFL